MGYVFSVQNDLAALNLIKTGQGMDKFRLTIAVNTGNTDNFTFADIQ